MKRLSRISRAAWRLRARVPGHPRPRRRTSPLRAVNRGQADKRRRRTHPVDGFDGPGMRTPPFARSRCRRAPCCRSISKPPSAPTSAASSSRSPAGCADAVTVGGVQVLPAGTVVQRTCHRRATSGQGQRTRPDRDAVHAARHAGRRNHADQHRHDLAARAGDETEGHAAGRRTCRGGRGDRPDRRRQERGGQGRGDRRRRRRPATCSPPAARTCRSAGARISRSSSPPPSRSECPSDRLRAQAHGRLRPP